MTKAEIFERMDAGEPLRLVSREVSGIREEATETKWEPHVRDYFLGRQRLTDEEEVLVNTLEQSGFLEIVPSYNEDGDGFSDETQPIFLRRTYKDNF